MKNKIELIANISLIAVGLTGGILSFINDMKDLSLILFSIALASILYQFLGGIKEETSFNLGALKFGGSAAVLIGFMFFFKKVVFVPSPSSAQGEYQIELSQENWIPINAETGKTEAISIKVGEALRMYPDSSLLKKRKLQEYQIIENDSTFQLFLLTDKKESVGHVNLKNLSANSLYNVTKIEEETEKRIKVFKLQPDIPSNNSTTDNEELALPFEIKVHNKSLFSILPLDPNLPPYLKDQEVVRKTSYLIPISQEESYVVFLEQCVSQTDSIHPELFSKWLVKKLKHELNFSKK